MQVCMLPKQADLGIGRVVEAYRKHGPAYGIEFVEDEQPFPFALLAVHAGFQPTTRQPDIHHCHGLYPTAHEDQGKTKLYEYNAYVIENARVAHVVTVPSQWVADIFRRDMHIDPVVLPHGIDVEDWDYVGGKPSDFVLWAKGHRIGVCDPGVLSALAAKLPNIPFVTTFGDKGANVKVIGEQSFDVMKDVMSQCGIYLAVTKETFGIQTLEAMALGKPVLGYDWGGTADIITHGHDGYLAKPGDIDDLANGLKWLMDYYQDVSVNARETVENRFGWDRVMPQLYDLYEDVLRDNWALYEPDPEVSVVIPCYNYGHRVADTIESVLSQTIDDWKYEIIVVNDGSTDDSMEVIQRYADKVIIVDIDNSGVAEARNRGIREATGKFITCIDSDDIMYPDTLELFHSVISRDRGMGIVYGCLDIMYSDSQNSEPHLAAWPPEFCYERQRLPKQNNVPSCCMFRKEAWLRAGGYRGKYTPAEDAELWTRITSLGFGAQRIADQAVYLYDAHDGSLSRTMKTGDHNEDKPWALSDKLVPFAAPACEYQYESYEVRNYDQPWVTVVIPVGPGHEEIVMRALDSVWRQSLPNWECIVVPNGCDLLIHPSTGAHISEAYPWAKVIRMDYENVAKARNVGAENAIGEFLSFLDADDYYELHYLRDTVKAYNEAGGDVYVYTDYYSLRASGELKPAKSKTFDPEQMKKAALHPITALVPKIWHDEVGGFDEDLEGWEDWDYYLKMSLIAGHCGLRVTESLMVYDFTSGARRDESYDLKDELLPIIQERYSMCRGRNCSKPRQQANPIPPVAAKAVGIGGRPSISPTRAGQPIPSREVDRVTEDAQRQLGMIQVVENSGNRGRHAVRGISSRTNYGYKKHGEVFYMHPADQQLQPHLYVIIPTQQEVPAARVAVQRPQPPAPAPRVPVEQVSQPVPPAPAVGEEEPELLGGYNAAVDGIDITVLPLPAIKRLDLSGEVAADAYEQELDGRARKTVLAYLATRFEVEEYFDIPDEE